MTTAAALVLAIGNPLFISAMAARAYVGMRRGDPFWPFFIRWYGPTWAVEFVVGTWMAASFGNPFGYVLAALGALGFGVWLARLGHLSDRLRATL